MLTEIAPPSEIVTAVMTSHLESGENFEGALIVGVYQDHDQEIWIQYQGHRTHIQCSDADALCKQLKRAKKIAQESKP